MTIVATLPALLAYVVDQAQVSGGQRQPETWKQDHTTTTRQVKSSAGTAGRRIKTQRCQSQQRSQGPHRLHDPEPHLQRRPISGCAAAISNVELFPFLVFSVQDKSLVQFLSGYPPTSGGLGRSHSHTLSLTDRPLCCARFLSPPSPFLVETSEACSLPIVTLLQTKLVSLASASSLVPCTIRSFSQAYPDQTKPLRRTSFTLSNLAA